jgi:DNA polymerase III alpha subunit
MMTDLKGRIVRSDGSVVNSSSTLIEILYSDQDIGNCISNDADEVKRFQIANKLCDTNLPNPINETELPYANILWNNHWFTPEPYASIDLKQFCYEKCSTDEEKQRVDMELSEFNSRNMTDAIKHCIYCVDIWRKNGIVWGVGRGSSVSSFVLYLIGITRLNPLKYNLDIKEWLK